MLTINMHEAKSRLSALVDAVESGREMEVVLARNGKPAARIVPLGASAGPRRRGGLAKGKFMAEQLDHDPEYYRRLFEDGPVFPGEDA